MSWVSQANIKTIMEAIRNKFTTSDLVVANSDKTKGAEFNYTATDGLVSVSPLSDSAGVNSAIWLANGDASKKTEITDGTLSYVTGEGDAEKYTYLSLLGNAATFGAKGGANIQVGGVADPTSAQQAATKNYVDSIIPIDFENYISQKFSVHNGSASGVISSATIEANSYYVYDFTLNLDKHWVAFTPISPYIDGTPYDYYVKRDDIILTMNWFIRDDTCHFYFILYNQSDADIDFNRWGLDYRVLYANV